MKYQRGLAAPLPDSVLDRYYAEHPDEVDHRTAKVASAETVKEAAIVPTMEDLERFFSEE